MRSTCALAASAQEPLRQVSSLTLPRQDEPDRTARYPVIYKVDGDNQLERYDNAIHVLHRMDAIPDLIVVRDSE
jgi:predicted alpha/beta superfamily hydrolase